MSIIVTVNGATYAIPEVDDSNWGAEVTDWAVALSDASLQKSGGSFTLTSEVDFGGVYGVKSAYFKSKASDAAAAGAFRLGNSETVSFRNVANDGDLALSINASDQLLFNGSDIGSDTNLQQAYTSGNEIITDDNGIFLVTGSGEVTGDLEVGGQFNGTGDITTIGQIITLGPIFTFNDMGSAGILSAPHVAGSKLTVSGIHVLQDNPRIVAATESLTISGIAVPLDAADNASLQTAYNLDNQITTTDNNGPFIVAGSGVVSSELEVGNVVTNDIFALEGTIPTFNSTDGIFSTSLTVAGVPFEAYLPEYIRGGSFDIEGVVSEELHVQPVSCRGANDILNIDTTVSGMKDFSGAWSAGYGQGGLASGAARTSLGLYYFFAIATAAGGVDYGWDDEPDASNLLSDAGGSFIDYRALAFTSSAVAGTALLPQSSSPLDPSYQYHHVPMMVWSKINISPTWESKTLRSFIPPNATVSFMINSFGATSETYGAIVSDDVPDYSVINLTANFIGKASSNDDFTTMTVVASKGGAIKIGANASNSMDIHLFVEGFRWNRVS